MSAENVNKAVNGGLCPRCGKPIMCIDLVTRVSKSGKEYQYLRYRHRKDKRTKRNKACYVKAPVGPS